MTELDDLYSRVRLLWEADPEQFEKDQPLLARALRDRPIDMTQTVQSLNAQLERLRAELRREQLQAEMQRATGKERERLLKKEWEAERRGAHALAAELEETRRQLAWAKRKPKMMPQETAMAGVSKGIAPD